MDKETLAIEVANALHAELCGCDAWDGRNCEDYYSNEMGALAAAALSVVRPHLNLEENGS